MGIKDLSKYIREHTTAYQNKHLSEFYGKKVAVDISVFLYKSIRSQGEENWVLSMVSLLICLKKYGIKIVCVFDGPNAPKEKLKERAERKKSSQKVFEKVDEIRKLIKIVGENISDFTDLSTDLRLQIKEACKKQRDSEKFEAIDYRNPHKALNALKITEQKFAKQCLPITIEHANTIKTLVEYLGMAVMQADGEAETLCAYMCVKKIVDAVLTEDTDVLAYGTPIFLSKIDTRAETVMSIDYHDLIDQFELSSSQFQDFCIMCSCDYNDRIKLIPKKPTSKPSGIGPVKAYKLLVEHGSIDNIEYMTELDLSPLIYERCRELFTIPNMYDGIVLPYNNPMDPNLESFLKKHNCSFMLKKIQQIWAPTPIEFISDEQLLSDDPPLGNEKPQNKQRSRLLEDNNDEEFSNDKDDKLCEDTFENFSKMINSRPKGHFHLSEEPSEELDDEKPKNRLLGNNDDIEILEPKNNNEKLKNRLLGNNDDEEFENLENLENKESCYVIFSDGSCIPNPGPGGWATLIMNNGEEIILKGGRDRTTNNQMELTGAIEGLKYINGIDKHTPIVTIHVDSMYVKDGITKWVKGWKLNGWKTKDKKPVKNMDLWKDLDRLNQKFRINWEWVKGHSSDLNNDRVDKIAKQEASKNLKNSYL